MIKPQQRRSVKRVNEICKHIIAGFNKFPVSELTTNNILEGSGLTRTSFYRYFESIDEAIAYIVRERYMQFKETLPKCKVMRDIMETIAENFSDLPEFMMQYVEHNSDIGIVGNFSVTAVVIDIDTHMRKSFGLSPDSDMLGMLTREAMRGKVHVNLM